MKKMMAGIAAIIIGFGVSAVYVPNNTNETEHYSDKTVDLSELHSLPFEYCGYCLNSAHYRYIRRLAVLQGMCLAPYETRTQKIPITRNEYNILYYERTDTVKTTKDRNKFNIGDIEHGDIILADDNKHIMLVTGKSGNHIRYVIWSGEKLFSTVSGTICADCVQGVLKLSSVT